MTILVNEVDKLIDGLNAAPPLEIPPNLATLDAMIETAAEFAKRDLIGTKANGDEPSIPPTWTLLTESGNLAIVGTPFVGPEGPAKDHAAAVLRRIMSEAKVMRFTFVSEAWVATAKKGESLDTAPRDRPDRREVLMVNAADRKQGDVVRTYDIIRDADGVVIDVKRDPEDDDLIGVSGRFASLLDVAKH